MSKRDDKRNTRDVNVIPDSKHPMLCDWLERLVNDQWPDRVKVCQVFGRGGRDHGGTLKQFEWKPNAEPVKREDVVAIVNEAVAICQQNCNALGRPARYGLFAYNVKKGDQFFASHIIALSPDAKVYDPEHGGGPASDDEDTHRDRLLSTALAHNRWQTEQLNDAMSGVMRLQQDIIKQQADTIARQDQERRAWIQLSEEMASRRAEREAALEWDKLKTTVLTDMWSGLKSYGPLVVGHLTAKAQKQLPPNAIVETLNKFIDSLETEQKIKLFGIFDPDLNPTTPGILSAEQTRLVVQVAEGKVDSSRLVEFIGGLGPEQLLACQQVLRAEQVQMLMALAQAVTAANSNANGAAAQA